ncbi:hypothetical protein QTP88_013776 [Uroleucon formosanum]
MSQQRRFSAVWQYMTAFDSTYVVCDVDQETEETIDVNDVVSLFSNTSLLPLTTIPSASTTIPCSSVSSTISSSSTCILKRKQSSIASFLPRKMTPDRKKCVDNALLNIIVTDFQPFKIVEDTGFKQFVNLLNPNYCLPTRQAISKTLIPLEYQKCVAKVEDLITNEADNVCVISIISKWKLEAKVVLVVSDNASNIKNAINTLHLRHLGCFAHTIKLVVKESLKCKSDLINKVKTIVTHFRKSTIAHKILEKNQINNGINEPRKLIQAVSTRWNSEYYMLERIASLEKPVRASLGLLENPPSSLTTIEWTIVKELCIVLKPFESATKVVSGENYMTAPMILHIVNGLFENLLFPSNSSLSENTKNEIVNDVTNIIKKIKSNNIEDSTHSVEHQHSVATEADEFSIWGTLNVHASQSRPTNTSRSRVILEVQNYLDDALVPRSKDPLEWWRQNYYNFPHLSILVRRMFCCQATSVPRERVFSKTGLLINELKTRKS